MNTKKNFILSVVTLGMCLTAFTTCSEQKKPATIGVYYFDGWAGQNDRTAPGQDWADEPWANTAPTHLSKRFVEEFSGREPLWGWRDDTQEIMERQIDLAADHGVDFFLFCWFWHDNKSSFNQTAIENCSYHTSMELYLKAKNKKRLQYSLLIANHEGFEIIGADNWKRAVKFWAKYFKDPQYIKVDGKPLVVIFNTKSGVTEEDLAVMQETAKNEGFKDGLTIAGCGAKGKPGFSHSTHYNIFPGYIADSEEHKFEEIVNATKAEWTGTEQQPYIPVLTAGWDKRPWEGEQGLRQPEGWYFPDSSPEKFKNFLTDAIQWMDDNPKKTTKERLVLIYAWNELGEGGYLVPTKDDPDAAKLKVIKSVVHGK